MPTNTQNTSAIEWHDVPPDLNCTSGDLNVLGARLAQFMTVVTVAGQTPGGTDDSIAQQALEVANIALSTANQALAAAPNKRTSGQPLAIATGDSTLNISWSPAMPDTDYEVRGTYYGANVAVAAYYNFRVIDGSRTVGGCQIRFDNTPANTKFAWVVEAL